MAQQIDIVANLLMKVDGAEAGLKKLQNSLSQLKMPDNLDASFKKSFSNLDGLLAKYKAQLKDGFQTKGDVTAFAKTGKQIEAEYDKISAAISKLSGKDVKLKIDLTAIHNAEKEIEKLVSQKEQLNKDIKGGLGLNDFLKAMQASDVGRRGTKVFDASNMLQTSLGRGDIEKAKSDVEGLISELNRMSVARKQALEARTGTSFDNIITTLRDKINNADSSLNKFNSDIKATTDGMARIQADGIERTNKALGEAASQAGKAQSGIKSLNGEAQQAANSMFSMANQLSQLQQSTQYFFGLRNMINLFKRGVREAIQSVKELDKAMTETAVVTKFDVGDMWNMLPQYTKLANELGATTQGAYETMTLYFQQGLDQTQAFELGAETMKMARIAGLDYAETTDMMTAALRGFNMELNAASAKRINDVYSNLAAKSASNTQELGEAMERTASIAHSAGMSFEGTSAFLAQMIETTREAPENLGTAMKTIIARFQELKENPLEMAEVDGEEVSFNKVDAALQTIGVSLKDTNGQFRELDKVFLDIAQRWDGLTQTQQRFIATTAAGSRQQSRFIAMMSNYSRTTELMSYANDSAGASQAQFEKTMDSLEAKLNKLHNAWQEFTMGIANNKMIKGAVDGITTLLGGVNKLINALSGGNGPVKSFLSTIMAFTGLRMTGRLINGLIGGFGGLLTPGSGFAKGFFGGGIIGNRANNIQSQAQAIYGPIVAELRALRGEQKKTLSGPYDQYRNFKAGRNQLLELTGKQQKYNVKDVAKTLDKLAPGNQMALMKTMPGTRRAIQKSLMGQYSNLGANPEQLKEIKRLEQSMRTQVQRGQTPLAEYYRAMMDPGKLLQQISPDNAAHKFLTGLNAQVNAEADRILTSNAMKMAAEQTKGYEKLDSKAQGKINAKYIAKAREDAAAQEAARQQALINKGYGSAENSKRDTGFDKANRVAAGIQSAGMAIMGFGSLLTSSANPAIQGFGVALTSVGSTISSLGMAFSGLVGATEALVSSKLMEAAASKIGIGAGQLTAGLGIAAVAIMGAALYVKKLRDDTRKEAEKVTSDYKEKNEKAQTNINNLQSWKEDFARLSSGVDQNGNNINLSQADYDRYLEIARGIAEINPKIVDGYNAQGQAIINNKNALEETLAVEKKYQQEAFKDYTSPEATEALQKARDLSKQHVVIQEEKDNVSYYGGSTTKSIIKDEYEFKPQANMRKQAQRIGSILQQGVKDGWASEDLLSDFGIEIGKLAEGDSATLQKFDELGPKIQQRINNSMSAAGDDIGEATKNSMLNAFTGYSDAADELDELITPIYDHMLAKMGPITSQIPDEFRTYFNQGLKAIVSDANITDIDAEANKLAGHFSTLTSEGSDYYQVMDQVAKAQDEYAATLDKTEYEKAANDAVNSLESIRTELGKNVDLSSGYGKAISEFLDNEIAKITSFTEEGTVNLTEALNTMTDEIAAAEGALENFNSVAEGSNYSTASSNLAKIYEEATSDVHTAGLGDQTFWAGAEALVGRESLRGKSQADAQEMMDSVNEMLKGGQEGWDNFKINWFDSVESMGGKLLDQNGEIIEGITYDENGWFETFDEKLNPQVYEQVADALHMSKDSLVAMLNLGRQFGEVDFSNIDEVRKGLATSDIAIQGVSSDKQGNRSMYVKESALLAEMAQAGITDINQQEEKITELAAKNVHVISETGKITADEFQDMGIKSMDSLIDVFDSTGQYTKDEMAAYAEKWSELNGEEWDPAKFNDAFAEHLKELETGEDVKQLSDLNSTTASIESILASMRIEEGHLDNPQADKIKQDILGGKGADTAAQLFSLGKNERGQQLSETEYQATFKELSNSSESLHRYIDSLQSAIDNDKVQGAEKDKFKAEIESVSEYLDYLDKYITDGKAAHEEQKRLQEEEKQAKEQAVENVKAENEKYQNRESQVDSGQMASGTQSEAQQQLQTMMSNGFSNLFSSIDPQQMMTPEIESAIGTLYSSYLTQGAQQATPEIQQALSTLGISLEDAIRAGLIIDEPGLTGTAESEYGEVTDGVKQAAKDAGDTAAASAEEAAMAAAETTGQLGALSTNIAQSVEQFASDINNITLPALKTPEITPSVTQGIEAVSNIATETVAATLTVDNVEANSKLEETKEIAQQAADTVGQGATFTINVPGLKDLDTAAKKATKLSSVQGNKSFNVSANVKGTSDVKSFNTAANTAKGLSSKTVFYTAVVSGTSNVWNAVSAGNSFENLRDHKVTYTTEYKQIGSKPPYTGGYITSAGVLYRAKGGMAEHPAYPKKGTDRIPAYLTPGEYVQNRKAVQYFGIDFMRNINHKDLIGALQSFGSAAKGRYGRLGPDGKGGLTLTGEKGYEVAWIPSENRSMILGANGPQMANLPPDTIIWDHKQSKKIVSQNAIPAGSHYVTSSGATDPRKKTSGSTSGKTSGGGGNNKATETVTTEAKEVVKNAGTVIVWWENAARRMDVIQKRVDDNQKRFEKLVKGYGVTRKSIQGTINNYKKSLNQQIALSNAQITQANKELKQFANSHTNNWRTRKEISYDEKYKENGEIKSKSNKITVDLSNFILFNKSTGAYEISQTAINAQAKVNQSKAEAIAQAAEKEINERNNKLKTAEDNLQKAQEALEKLANDVYEAFYSWEKSITQVYIISKRLETLNLRLENSGKEVELQYAKMNAGLLTQAEAQETILTSLEEKTNLLVKQALGQSEKLKAAQDEYNNLVNFRDDMITYSQNNQSTEAQGDMFAKTQAAYLVNEFRKKDGTFDYEAAIKTLEAQNYNKETYDKIKENIDKLYEAQQNVLNVYGETKDTILQIYSQLSEYQSYVAEFEESLLSGMEEQAEKQVNKLDKINTSLSKAYKELLDEIKRKLDDRRKKEDNVKTESDLTQKLQRLAALQADTSGGHAVEIAQLEKEIAEAQQNYQRTLEDQLLEKLQQQGDLAEKQRQRQIELLSVQNEIAKETGNNLDEVRKWLQNPTEYYEQMRAAWLSNKGYDEAVESEQKKLEAEWEAKYAEYVGSSAQIEYLKNQLDAIDGIETSVNQIADKLTELIPSGFSVDAARGLNMSTGLVKKIFTDEQIVKSNYTPQTLKQMGYTADQFAQYGRPIADAIAAGFDAVSIAHAYHAETAMKQGNVSGKYVQRGTGATPKQLQGIINSNQNDNAIQSDMAGVKISITSTDKKTTMSDATFNSSGTQVFGHSGSTIYTQGWNSKTGQLTGTGASKYASIGALTPDLLKKAGDQGIAALLYAIQHQTFGSVINKNFKGLISAVSSQLVGKEVNLANGWTGSIGSDGLIYQNYATGVKKWNPATGTITEDKYTAAKKQVFLNVAKRNSETSREYAQVLMNNKAYTKAQLQAKGVKKFRTGGLANFTGPAWLDGTPSKPELVLNATDTKNFIALKDVLSKAIGSTHAISNEYGGDTTFEININVDHIANDYDVDKMAERVKKIIVKDSSYRNVTQVRKFR